MIFLSFTQNKASPLVIFFFKNIYIFDVNAV